MTINKFFMFKKLKNVKKEEQRMQQYNLRKSEKITLNPFFRKKMKNFKSDYFPKLSLVNVGTMEEFSSG